MDTLSNIHPGKLHLLTAPADLGCRLATDFTARLALGGPVHVLDGGNRFDFHTLARLLRRQTPHLEQALRHVQVARAFTCYQVEVLLAGQTPGMAPVLMLDILATFVDENVSPAERQRLLARCLVHLHGLARETSVLVTAAPRRDGLDQPYLDRLRAEVDHLWHFENASPDAPLYLL